MTYSEILDQIIQKHKEKAGYWGESDDVDAEDNEAIEEQFVSWLNSVKNLASDEELNEERDEGQMPMIESEEWGRFCDANGYNSTGHRFNPNEE